MLKRYVFIIFSSLFIMIFFAQTAQAVSQNIMISQIKLGDATSAKNEFVEIYNNSLVDVEITDWCLSYLSSSLSPREMACFTPEDDSIHIFLPSHSFALATTAGILLYEPPIIGDIEFSSTLSDSAGYVRLLDKDKIEIDKVGWGTSTPENNLVEPSPDGKVLSRKIIDINILQDSNVNSDDFEIIEPKLLHEYDSVYELHDICPNIIDIQIDIPDDREIDIKGDCITPPTDFCSNLLYIQTIIPDGYVRGDDNDCLLDLLPLKITELLPNIGGIDTGKEFIEIYNPNISDVDLANYIFYVGTDDVKFYSFPIGLHIDAGQYLAFYNDEINFTLLNTTSSVRLKSIDGNLIDETLAYNDPKEDMTWALIDELWQYTNRPTASGENLPSLIIPDPPAIVADVELVDGIVPIVVASELKPCAANQYRSPETNRCRLIPVSESVLTPCKDGQYRSEETNRCRSIISDVAPLVACSEGEERNPETNRCRSIVAAVLGASELKPCDVGQERNPDTNRCRNIVSAMPQADYAPEKTNEASNNYVLWWSLAGVGFVAIVYGIWEWRQEIGRLIQKIRLLRRKK